MLTTGLHPSSARVVALDVVTYTATGNKVRSWHAVVNPRVNPGPTHLHGLTREKIEQARPFRSVIRQLDSLLDGLTLLVHDAPRTWGFIVSETKRARRKSRRPVGHVPRPVAILDTLECSRRAGMFVDDTRIRGLAQQLGYRVQPTATVKRAKKPSAQIQRTDTKLVASMYFDHFAADSTHTAATRDPDNLKADRFGLQRSAIRVDAAAAARRHSNPGLFTGELAPGLEVVIAPEVEVDPNTLVEGILASNLSYSEKVTRETSLLICNKTETLRGKAMHAKRKGIPIISDTEFLALA